MTKKSKTTHEALAKRLIEELLARLDTPVNLTAPEANLESVEIDEDWSLLKDVHPELLEDKPEPATIKRLEATVSGSKPITIRVPNRVLKVFRRQADITGTPYQTLLNRVLAEAANSMK